jgi:hypothetical protein
MQSTVSALPSSKPLDDWMQPLQATLLSCKPRLKCAHSGKLASGQRKQLLSGHL